MANSDHFRGLHLRRDHDKRHPVLTSPLAIVASIPAIVATCWRNIASFFQSVQVARMTSALAQMSDSQLAQIGISRSEIYRYAEYLTSQDESCTYESYLRKHRLT